MAKIAKKSVVVEDKNAAEKTIAEEAEVTEEVVEETATETTEEAKPEAEVETNSVEKIGNVQEEEAKRDVFAESKRAITKKSGSAIKTFAKEQERVLTVSGEERASNVVDEYGKALIELSMSKSNKTLLRDRIDSIEKKNKNYAAVVYHGPFKVYIPATKLIQPITEALPGSTLAETYGYVLQSRLGAEVEYVCEDFDADAKMAMGNHLEACEIYQKRYFIDIDRTTNMPRVYAGRNVEARVLAVRKFGVLLDVFGFEKFVPVKNLTYSRLEHAAKEFSVDDIIEVKITGVEYEKDSRNRNSKVKDIQLSAKELKTNPLRKALETCTPGAYYTGEVVMIDENAIFVSCSFGDVKATCYCPYPAIGVRIGSKVTVRVKNADLNTLQLWGNIIRANKI